MTRPLDSLTPEQQSRMCPTCRLRWMLEERVTTNYQTLPLDRRAWYALRRAAEAFDEDVELFSARAFVDWLKADCEGFRSNFRDSPFVDGAAPRNIDGSIGQGQHSNVHRHPHPLPVATRGERHTRGKRATA